MSASSGKVVKAALVIVFDEAGRQVYAYRGAPLPDGLKDGEVERLDALGMLEDTPTAAAPAAVKATPTRAPAKQPFE